jgi:hypothetical protein
MFCFQPSRNTHHSRIWILAYNSLCDDIAPAVISLLNCNSDLLTLDLSGNNGLKAESGGNWDWYLKKITPAKERGKAMIVRKALFNTSSLQAIGNESHLHCEDVWDEPGPELRRDHTQNQCSRCNRRQVNQIQGRTGAKCEE